MPEMWQKVANFKGAEYFRKALYMSMCYPEHIPVHVIEAILKHGIRLVRPALDRPKHRCFLF